MATFATQCDKAECLAFLLLHAAKADMHITPEEERWILERCGPLAAERARKQFEEQSDYDNVQTMLQLRDRFFADADSWKRFEVDIETLFRADGHYTTLEHNFLLAIERLFK